MYTTKSFASIAKESLPMLIINGAIATSLSVAFATYY